MKPSAPARTLKPQALQTGPKTYALTASGLISALNVLSTRPTRKNPTGRLKQGKR